MHEIAGPALLVWIESSGFAQAMREWLWLYPAIEIAHITGIVLLVGAAAMFDLRLLGVSATLPVSQLAHHLLPWSAAGFALLVITGLMMFSAHATEFWSNPVFLIKMTLIVLAGLNALAFHAGVFRGVSGWNTGARAPAAGQMAALASLALWLGVISSGRLLAYL